MADSLAVDRLDIAETVYRYAVGIDTRDWALYRSIFADDVVIDFESYNGVAAASMPADAWVANLTPVFAGLAATQHAMSNPITAVSGDEATCRMYIQAHVLDPDDPASWFTIGGFYDDRLRRSDPGPAGWLLTAVRLTVLWRRGDEAIMAIARQRGVGASRVLRPGRPSQPWSTVERCPRAGSSGPTTS